MPLYHKYRPQTLDEFAGNRSCKESLESVLERDEDVPHAFLFTGPSGTGKTTLGRIVAKMLGVKTEFDLTEMNSADFRGIDSIRDLSRKAQTRSMTGAARVWIIDECHKLTNDAQNALLKLLEDSPKHAYFLLCTTDPHKLLKTIHTRCSTFETSPLTNKQMRKLLNHVVESEDATVPDEALEMIVNNSQGSARQALTTLDTIIDMPEERMVRVANRSVNEEKESIDLARALMDKRSDWARVSAILRGLRKNCEVENVRRVVLGYATTVVLNKPNDQAANIIYHFEDNTYDAGFPKLVRMCWEAINS